MLAAAKQPRKEISHKIKTILQEQDLEKDLEQERIAKLKVT